MTRIRIIVLTLVAMFAISAVAATMAIASEGVFVNTKGEALKKTKFTGTSGATELLSSGGGIKCKKDTAHGVLLNKEEGAETILFQECELLGSKCSGGKDEHGTAGAGEIYVLVGTRTRQSPGRTEQLLLLSILQEGTLAPATEAKPFALKCGTITVKVYGSFLVHAGALATPASLWTFTAKTNGSNENTPSEYENEVKEKVKDVLHSNFGVGWGVMAVVGSEDVVFEEQGEFRKE